MSITRGIQVFISYSSRDRWHAERLAELIRRLEMVPFSFKRTSLLSGNDYVQALKYTISQTHFFVVLLNESRSEFVDTEIGLAQGQEKVIIPVLLSEQAPR